MMRQIIAIRPRAILSAIDTQQFVVQKRDLKAEQVARLMPTTIYIPRLSVTPSSFPSRFKCQTFPFERRIFDE